MSGPCAAVLRSPRPISNSELKTFKRCRRRWWLGIYRGLRPAASDPFGLRDLGDRIHKLLGLYYDPNVGNPSTAEETIAAWDLETIDLYATYPELEREIAADSELGKIMLEGYFQWIAEEGMDADWEVVAAEDELAIPLDYVGLLRPAELVGKKDLTVHVKSSGIRLFVDHKTVQNLTDLPKIADIDEQFLHYGLLDLLDHRAKGEPGFVDGGIFNMIRRVKRTANAKPPFFGREEVRHNIDELRSYWLRLVGEVLELQRAEDRLLSGEDHRMVAYPTPSKDCSWDCEFRSVCPMLDDPHSHAEEFLSEAYVVGDPYARYGAASKTETTEDAR